MQKINHVQNLKPPSQDGVSGAQLPESEAEARLEMRFSIPSETGVAPGAPTGAALAVEPLGAGVEDARLESARSRYLRDLDGREQVRRHELENLSVESSLFSRQAWEQDLARGYTRLSYELWLERRIEEVSL